jgi:hypothetical protein
MTQVNVSVGTPGTPGVYAQFYEPVKTFVNEAGGDGAKIANKLGEWFNVVDFGATDGAADNSTAVQAAINACVGAGGGTVFFPEGTWTCLSTLSITTVGRVHFKGAGETATNLRLHHATTGLHVNGVLGYFSFSDIRISGNGTSSGSTALLLFTNAFVIKFTNVNIADGVCQRRFAGCVHIQDTNVTSTSTPQAPRQLIGLTNA